MTTIKNTQRKGKFTYATLETNGETFKIYTCYFSGVKGVWNQDGGIYNPKLNLFAGEIDREMSANESEMANFALENI